MVVQLGERQTEDLDVAGSSPAHGTYFFIVFSHFWYFEKKIYFFFLLRIILVSLIEQVFMDFIPFNYKNRPSIIMETVINVIPAYTLVLNEPFFWSVTISLAGLNIWPQLLQNGVWMMFKFPQDSQTILGDCSWPSSPNSKR